MVQFLRKLSLYPSRMRMGHLTPELLLAVPCPSCAVAARGRCLLHAGGFRNEPRVEAKVHCDGGCCIEKSFPSWV